jgi:nitroreductase
MLRPVSWNEQPFRFVALHENDHRRLRAAIPGAAESVPAVPEVRASKVESTPAKMERLSSSMAPPSLLALDGEQPWIEKYRTAVSTKPPRRIFRKIFLGALTVAALSMGIIFAFQPHLIWW